MSADLPVPETRVLAIASHVVYGYVGNTIAVFVMQSLGCEVAAINTVHFSNHTGYRQVKGTKTSASEITDIFSGLKASYLDDFDMMLSGYAPGAEAVQAVGAIGRELKLKATMKPGSFFWVLDPVMGDNGRLYVAEDVVPACKTLIRDADLILPNQFEAELLSGVKIHDLASLEQAIATLHSTYLIPHIIVTSVSFPSPGATPSLSVIGSTLTSTNTPRLFRIIVPSLDCYFSGCGDMFAALILVRLREEVSKTEGLSEKGGWISGDEVEATELPLARAAEKVLAAMHRVLQKTMEARNAELELKGGKGEEKGEVEDEEAEKKAHLRRTKAAEVRLVRNVDCLRDGEVLFRAEKMGGA